MKQEPNNSIDLLLRQLGRQEEVFPSHEDAQHLDADELNSYVANALPAKTRARYTHHLADCSSCRKTVAQLSAAEGVAVVRRPAAVVGPSGWKSFLASFFSPMVLRYAVPALGVILITVVGIVVFRQNQYENETSVAQVTKTDENKAAPETPRGLTTPAATPNPEQPKEAARAEEAKRADVAAPASAPAPVTTTAEVSADAPPAPKATPAEEAEPEKKAESEANKDAAAREGKQYDTAKADEAVRKEKQQQVAGAAPATAMTPGNTAPEPRRAKMGVATGAGGVASTENAPDTRDFSSSRGRGNFMFAETRSVAGRQFRKEGDVWIDVAYSPSQSTTIVKRGTEQYRGLIADEPEIHTIAENLKSEFVVVWKGRAYRVR